MIIIYIIITIKIIIMNRVFIIINTVFYIYIIWIHPLLILLFYNKSPFYCYSDFYNKSPFYCYSNFN